ncbi:MAG: hypothetical protein HWE10_05900 [Gammaproteobacteria bacterium]|nr:hypothetical protein [Gammaproteobacteria bacterium]
MFNENLTFKRSNKMNETEKVDIMTSQIEQLQVDIESELDNYEDFNFPEDSLIKKLIDERKSLVLERALLWRELKSNGQMPYTKQEEIIDKLNEAFSNAKSNEKVELEGQFYLKRFQPVELSKTGKSVKKYWSYWLKLHEGGAIDRNWQSNIHQIWPDKFLINPDRNKARKC